MRNVTFNEQEIYRLRQAVECHFERLNNHGGYDHTDFYAEYDALLDKLFRLEQAAIEERYADAR